MKIWVNRIAIFLLSLGTILVWNLALNDQQELIMESPFIQLELQNEMPLLNKKDILTSIQKSQLFYSGFKRQNMNIAVVEDYLSKLNEVEKAEVFYNVGETWNIHVKLKKPIARIIPDSSMSFYLDSHGQPFNLIKKYHAHIIPFTGINEFDLGNMKLNSQGLINNDSLITNKKLTEIYRISNYVCNSAFYSALIVQVHFSEEEGFVLIPRVGKHKIIFGRAPNEQIVAEKFEKLSIFYKEVIPYEGWEKYHTINLKFENQIVATKK